MELMIFLSLKNMMEKSHSVFLYIMWNYRYIMDFGKWNPSTTIVR